MTIYTNGDSAFRGSLRFILKEHLCIKIEFDSSLKVDSNRKYIFDNESNVNVSMLLEKIKINNLDLSIGILSFTDIIKENDDLIVTGDKLVISKDNIVSKEYVISILGDVNSDGLIPNNDALKLYDYLRVNIDMEDIYICSIW